MNHEFQEQLTLSFIFKEFVPIQLQGFQNTTIFTWDNARAESNLSCSNQHLRQLENRYFIEGTPDEIMEALYISNKSNEMEKHRDLFNNYIISIQLYNAN